MRNQGAGELLYSLTFGFQILKLTFFNIFICLIISCKKELMYVFWVERIIDFVFLQPIFLGF